MAPGLSLAGVRLVIADLAVRLPVLRTLSLCTCCRHYPGAAAGRNLHSCTQPYQPSPISLSGRPARRFFRGLLGVHSRCGLHTRTVTKSRPLSRGFRHFVTSMPAPVASGWSGCRVGLAPTGKRRLARRTGLATISNCYSKQRLEQPLNVGGRRYSAWKSPDFRDFFNSPSDILQLSGRLRSLRNFSLSEWRRWRWRFNRRFPSSPLSNASYGSSPSTSYTRPNLRYSAILCDAAVDRFGMTSHWSLTLRRRSARTG